MVLGKKIREGLMKLVVRIADVVALARRFEEAPAAAMREVVEQARDAVRVALEKVMNAQVRSPCSPRPGGPAPVDTGRQLRLAAGRTVPLP